MYAGWYEDKLKTRWYVHQLHLEREHAHAHAHAPRDDEADLLGLIEANEAQWKRLESAPAAIVLRYDDIPWIRSDAFMRAVSRLDKTLHKDLRKQLLLRWHPDRFNRYFGKRIHSDDIDRINEGITATCQAILSALSV
jgi:hypothetical protein